MSDHSDDHSDDETHDAPREDARRRSLLTVVATVVLLACLASLTFLVVDRGSVGAVFAQSATAQDDRDAVASQAEQFALRFSTYGPDDLDEQGLLTSYVDGLKEVITPKFATSLEQTITVAEQRVQQLGLATQSEVYAVAVSSVDDDTATALAAGTINPSAPDPDQPDDASARIQGEPVPFRLVITLRKIEGEWLVDDFRPAGQEEGELPDGVPSDLGESESAEPDGGAGTEQSPGAEEPSIGSTP